LFEKVVAHQPTMSKRVAIQVLRALEKLKKVDDDPYGKIRKSMKGSLLKWRHIGQLRRGAKTIYTIYPQLFDDITRLDSNHEMIVEGYFYEYEGNAVSGSGADFWLIADQKALDGLNRILVRIESKQQWIPADMSAQLGPVTGRKFKKYIVRVPGGETIVRHGIVTGAGGSDRAVVRLFGTKKALEAARRKQDQSHAFRLRKPLRKANGKWFVRA
jgi:hypothetical protein